MNKIESGVLLVSDPFLKDPNFLRSVILVCEHEAEGSLGFVLNKPYSRNLNQLIDGVDELHYPVFSGGPVQLDSLHFLHTKPRLIEGGLNIVNGIYWGGNFEQALELMKTKQITPRDIRFYIGYSGWSIGQLDAEVEEKSWLIHNAARQFVFHHNADMLWKDVVKDMGGDYKQLVNYPIDPQLN
ncbi:MAG: YqgE/AlgH family protein [Chitinophagaceae bacterium]